jgi:hypothetical protein
MLPGGWWQAIFGCYNLDAQANSSQAAAGISRALPESSLKSWRTRSPRRCDPSPVFVTVLMRELGNSPHGGDAAGVIHFRVGSGKSMVTLRDRPLRAP